MTPKTLRQTILDEIQAATPDLAKKDINDLVTIAESDDPKAVVKLQRILTDYKQARKLNAPQISQLIKFFEALNPFAKLLGAVAKL